MFGEFQVEARIVHEDQRVGGVVGKGFFGASEIAEHLWEMAYHFAESHEGHVAVVYYGGVSGLFGHEVASEKCYLCVWVLLQQRCCQS